MKQQASKMNDQIASEISELKVKLEDQDRLRAAREVEWQEEMKKVVLAAKEREQKVEETKNQWKKKWEETEQVYQTIKVRKFHEKSWGCRNSSIF